MRSPCSHNMQHQLQHSRPSLLRLRASPAGGPKVGRSRRALRMRAAMPTAEQLQAQQKKVIYLIRHAQGYHNVGYEHLDAHLNETGWKQAEALGRYMQYRAPPIDVVLISPLTRTLETASAVFGRQVPLKGLAKGLMGPPLMRSIKYQLNACADYGPIARPVGGFKLEATMRCREMMANPPDQLRHLSETKAQFPGVDFSSLEETDADHQYEACHTDGQLFGETFAQLNKRASSFAEYLLTRPETHIAVVAHVNFNRALLQGFSGTRAFLPYGRDFENCELMSFQLANVDGAPQLMPAIGSVYPSFAGGSKSIDWKDPTRPDFKNNFRPAFQSGAELYV